MKFIISERQYKILKEQSDYAMDRRGNALLNTTGIRGDKDYKEVNQITNKAQVGPPLDPHTLMTIAQIGTAFIPLVGPFISMGIGLADAALYYQEGDTKTAGLIGLFSMLPGVGGLASKLGLGKWSAKALGEIGKKISLGSKLSPVEVQVANRVAQYKQLIQSEMAKLGEKGTIGAAKDLAKKQIVKTAVVNTGKNVGKELATYAGTGYLYNKGYDIIKGQPQVDLSSVNTKDVNDVNKKAATEINFN